MLMKRHEEEGTHVDVEETLRNTLCPTLILKTRNRTTTPRGLLLLEDYNLTIFPTG